LSPRKKTSSSVILTERALSDLRAIEGYSVAEWGRRTADKYLDDIATALDLLASNPEVLRHELEFASNLVFYRVRKHYLVCDVRGKNVYVLTVIHTSMDIPTRLAELEPQLLAEVEFLHARLRPRNGKDE